MIFTSRHLRALLIGAALSVGLAAVTLAPQIALAQAVSGDITGVVTDASKAMVTRANVVATNVATGIVYTAVTDGVGEYHLFNLPPGTYNISASAPGFSKSVLTGFAVELNKVSTADITLRVSANETVEVSAAAGVALDTTTAQVETSFSAEQLTELPAAANNVLNLSLMTAGVSSSGGMGQGTGPAVGGQRPTDNNYMVEGIDNNDKSVPGPLLNVPSDAVSEFTTLQNQFSAEYGHSNGGQFNQIIKSGTNSFHGLAYEYSQNRNYNAVDAFQAARNVQNKALGVAASHKDRSDDNRFGGQIGGPILKNKLFFFANYEQEPNGAPGSAATFCAPTSAGFTALDSLNGLSANNLAVFKKYSPVASAQSTGASSDPCPSSVSVAGTSIPVGDVNASAGSYLNSRRSINSVDYTISEKDSLRARYLYNSQNGPDTTATFPSFWATAPNLFHLATFSEFHTFSPNLTSEFRLGYNRFYSVYTAPGSFPGMSVFPNLTIDDLSGVDIGPDPNAPQGTIQNTYQGSESIIWSRAKHTIKTGYEYRDVISPQLFVQRARGDYEWGTLSGYLQDLSPDIFGERNATAPGVSPTYYGNQTVSYAYINDDWKIMHNLTLNLGVRYEFTSVPLGELQQKANIAASVPGLISFASPKAQKANFVPRFGFAYSPDSNTVVRGGFGMGYDVLYDNLGTLAAAPQYQVTEDVDTKTITTGFLAGGGLPANVTIPDLATQRALTSAYVPDQKLPYAENWSLGVERTFKQNYTAEVRYIGTRGIHLPTQNRINRQSITTSSNNLPLYFAATPGINSPTAPSLVDVESNGSSYVQAYSDAGFESSIVGFMPWSESNYNGLATQLNRRFTHGLLLDAAYTWSKTMDDATATAFSTYLTPRRSQDFRNIGSDYSRSALDHTHRLTFAVVYDVPFFLKANSLEKNLLGNWEIAPVYTYQSPEWATVQSNADANLNGDAAGDRAYINPAGKKGTGTATDAYANKSLTGLCLPDDPTLSTDPNGTVLCDADTAYYVAEDPSAYYVQAQAGTQPNSGRNTLPIRPIDDMDVTALKRFSITERYKVEFTAQIWNVLNHSQYLPGAINNINSVGYIDGATHNYLIPGSPNFNKPESTFNNNARAMQLALKFKF
jgi:hypothetical protein